MIDLLGSGSRHDLKTSVLNGLRVQVWGTSCKLDHL
jgi:hypothetical protein